MALSAEMKALRLKKGLSLRQMQKKVGKVYTYLFELERGVRNWNPKLVEAYRKVCR